MKNYFFLVTRFDSGSRDTDVHFVGAAGAVGQERAARIKAPAGDPAPMTCGLHPCTQHL